MRKLLVIFALLLSNILVFASPTTITGIAAKEYFNQTIYLSWLEDAISNHQKIIAEAKVDGQGNFSITTDIPTTGVATLSINRIKGTLFVKPGQNYRIEFPYLSKTEIKSFSGINTVDLILFDLPETDPNFQIGKFNLALEEFNIANLDIAFTTSYQKKVLDFWRTNRQNAQGNGFVANYIHFACANTALSSGLNGKKVFQYFVDSAAIHTQNPEFGVFVNAFFKNILFETDRYSGNEEIKITINNAPRAYKILEELKKNDFLENLQLREIVALNGLQEIYNYGGYNKKNILDLCDQIGLRTIYEDVRVIAKNVKSEITWMQPGSPIPSYNLSNSDGEMFTPTDFNSKPSLYFFWAPWSKVALNELQNLQTKQKEWGDAVNYVLIAVSENDKETKLALSLTPNLMGEMLHQSSDPKIIDRMKISTIPHLMMVDKDGKIIRYYASSIDEITPILSKSL